MSLRPSAIGVEIKKKKRKKVKKMSNNILISKDDIIKLLERSYEQGYDGYLDIKSDCVKEILNDYLCSKNVPAPYLNSSSLSVNNDSILNDPYSAIYPNLLSHISATSSSTTSTNNSTVDNSGQITISFNY